MNSLTKFLPKDKVKASEQTLSLKVLKSSGKPTSRFQNLTCVIAPLSQSKKVTDSFPKKNQWSEGAKKQLTKKMKDWENDEKVKSAATVHFDEGGACQFLFLKPNVTVFELHSWFRELFAVPLKLDWEGPIELVLSDLPKNLQPIALEAFSCLLALVHWESPKTSKKPKKVKTRHFELQVQSSLSPKEISQIAEQSFMLGKANNFVRTLAEIPPNMLNPQTYSELVEARAKEQKYKFEFYDHKKLEKMGAGAFLAVARAAPESTGIVHIWKPGKKNSKKLALVGKGLCFDTGGYDVKVKHMYGMKNDMTGSAVALAIFETLLKIDFPHEVHAYLALTENLISPTAYKPNEVVTAMDGTTIEVQNTDAEGRMALADTLALARKINPDLVIDFATLTGVAVYALDTKRSAIFGGPPALLEQAVAAGERSGERTWSFPIGEDYKDGIKSTVADLLQCRMESPGDHIYAATFLQNFIGEETNWVHVDLAACENKGGLGLVNTLTTGFGVRWGIEFVSRYFKTTRG
ncbi:MAG: leucyl aminopeptidase family protein [Bdellovibrionales bacterium]